MQTKRFLVAVIATIALSLQSFAQGQLRELTTLDNIGFTFLPPSFSCDGEVNMLLVNFDDDTEYIESFSIKDLEGNDVSEIKIPHFSYNSFEYYSPVSCDTVVYIDWIDSYRVYNYYHDPDGGDPYFYDLHEYSLHMLDGAVFFTTLDGREACYPQRGFGFYKEDLYGTKYPRCYYTYDDDGYVIRCDVIYEETTTNYKFSSTPFKTETYTEECIGFFAYQDFASDASSFEIDDDYVVSQSLFNDDSNWEYWNSTWGSLITEDYIDYDYWSIYDSIRVVRYSTYLRNLSLVNDKGETLFEIPIEDIEGCYVNDYEILYAQTEDKDLIVVALYYSDLLDREEVRTTIYSYDKGLSALRAIARTESTRMSVNVTDSQVNVRVNNADKAESVSLSDMTGRIVGRIPATSSGSSISTSKMSKGVYNITLQGAGNIENQKILIE